ncbi:hypothetical protein ACKLNR_003717 [Fusarium oxysporum f. sp. zingiberi]
MSSESQPTAEQQQHNRLAIEKRDNDLFGGNVDIVRSIPAVCLIDSIFDLFVLAGGISRFLSSHNSTQQTRRNSPKATGLVIRLALTIFTVLPQTIKVFSLQGVPATQICAFIFFFANITKLLVSICGWEPEGIIQEKDDSTSIDVLLSLFQTFHGARKSLRMGRDGCYLLHGIAGRHMDCVSGRATTPRPLEITLYSTDARFLLGHGGPWACKTAFCEESIASDDQAATEVDGRIQL